MNSLQGTGGYSVYGSKFKDENFKRECQIAKKFRWMFKHSDGEVSWVLNLNLVVLFRQWFTLDLE